MASVRGSGLIDVRSWALALAPLLAVLGAISCSGKSDSSRRMVGACPDLLPAHTGDVNAIVFSPDGKFLATASSDRSLKLWDMPSGRLAAVWKDDTTGFFSLAFSPDGKWLATGSFETIKLWEFPSGKLAGAWGLQSGLVPGSVRALAFSPDGRHLASASDDGQIKVWEMPKGNLLTQYQSTHPFSVTFGPEGRLAFQGEGSIAVLKNPMGDVEANFGRHGDEPYSLAFSPDGKRLAAGYFKSIRIWEKPAEDPALSLHGLSGGASSLAFSRDGKWLGAGLDDNAVLVWAMPGGKQAYTLSGHGENVTTVAFSPDGSLFASGSEDNTVRIWTVSSGELSSCLSDTTSAARAASGKADSTRTACPPIEEAELFLVDGSTLQSELESGVSPEAAEEEPMQEAEQEEDRVPEAPPYEITGCRDALLSTRFAMTYLESRREEPRESLRRHTFDLAGRKEIRFPEELETHKIGRFTDYVLERLEPRMAEIGNGLFDSSWNETRPDLELYLEGDSILVGYSNHLGFSEAQETESSIPESVFTSVPWDELRKYLKRNSPLRRLGRE